MNLIGAFVGQPVAITPSLLTTLVPNKKSVLEPGHHVVPFLIFLIGILKFQEVLEIKCGYILYCRLNKKDN
jgi:hypothetical protein